MTWFGPASAWAAAAVGFIMLGLAALLQMSSGGIPTRAVIIAIAAVLLLLASYRTLNAKSGGLRLLAGAWGLAAGLSLSALSMTQLANSAPLSTSINVLPWIALTGLALTVLHKEQKKPA